MKCHMTWPEDESKRPVQIVKGGGVNAILKAGYLTAQFKVRYLKRLGVILDSDGSPEARFKSVKSLLSSIMPDFPAVLDSNGLITSDQNGKKFGLWVMPDNVENGTLETFLKHLVPSHSRELWELAASSTNESRAKGASYKDSQKEKAELHTWLSWHDAPGQGPGRALTNRVLHPDSSYAESFVKWFRTLYEV